MNQKVTLPAISLRGLVVFPSMVLHFDVGRERSVNALKAAADSDGQIFLVAQKDPSVADPDASDLYEVGVVAEVRQLLTTPDGSTRVLVEGLYRAKRIKTISRSDHFRFEVKEISNRGAALSDTTRTACIRSLKDAFVDYAQVTPKMPRELYDSIVAEEDCAKLFEKIVFNVVLRVEDKQKLLETNGTLAKIKTLITMLHSELEIIETEILAHLYYPPNTATECPQTRHLAHNMETTNKVYGRNNKVHTFLVEQSLTSDTCLRQNALPMCKQDV